MSLEEKAYKALPISIRRYIMTNPEKYPEYSQVLLNNRRNILKKNKNKINLDPNEIKLMLTIVRIYNHIKENPPIGNIYSHALNSWNKFIKLYYPDFKNLDDIDPNFDYDEYQETWTKSFWLVYYTYLISYRNYYNLKAGIQEKEYTLYYNRKKDNFSMYIYTQYKYLNQNVSLEKFQFWGY